MLLAFTLFHVALSLAGIGAGFVVVYGLLVSKMYDGWTKLFLITTVATSITGYMFPAHKITPGHVLGFLSLIVLTFAILGRYHYRLAGSWRRTYAITAVVALYLNVFVLIVQLFEKVPALKALAPRQSDPPFEVAQLGALVIFALVAVMAAVKFHGEPVHA